MLKRSLTLSLVLAVFLIGCSQSPKEVAEIVFVKTPIHVIDEVTHGFWDLTNDTPVNEYKDEYDKAVAKPKKGSKSSKPVSEDKEKDLSPKEEKFDLGNWEEDWDGPGAAAPVKEDEEEPAEQETKEEAEEAKEEEIKEEEIKEEAKKEAKKEAKEEEGESFKEDEAPKKEEKEEGDFGDFEGEDKGEKKEEGEKKEGEGDFGEFEGGDEGEKKEEVKEEEKKEDDKKEEEDLFGDFE